MKGPESQLNVDSTGTRWCMMIGQWPLENTLVWSSGRSADNIPARVIPALDKKFPTPVLFMSFYTVSQPGFGVFGQPRSPYPPFSGRRAQRVPEGSARTPEMPGSLVSGRSSTRPTAPRLNLSTSLVLQRRFKEGRVGRHEGRLGAWHGSVWPARCILASPPATAAVQPARTVPGAASPAPPGRPAVS